MSSIYPDAAPQITPLVPDTSSLPLLDSSEQGSTAPLAAIFGQVLAMTAQGLEQAQTTEGAMLSGQGTLLQASVSRAEASAQLSLCAAVATRVASCFTTFANMAV